MLNGRPKRPMRSCLKMAAPPSSRFMARWHSRNSGENSDQCKKCQQAVADAFDVACESRHAVRDELVAGNARADRRIAPNFGGFSDSVSETGRPFDIGFRFEPLRCPYSIACVGKKRGREFLPGHEFCDFVSDRCARHLHRSGESGQISVSVGFREPMKRIGGVSVCRPCGNILVGV